MFTSLSAIPAAMGVQRVDAIGATLSDFDLSSAVVAYAMIFSGEVDTREGGPFIEIGQWLLQGAAGDYEVKYSPTGDAPDGDQLDTWLSLASTRAWSFTVNSPASFSCSGTLSIRLASNSVVLDTATVSLSATVEP